MSSNNMSWIFTWLQDLYIGSSRVSNEQYPYHSMRNGDIRLIRIDREGTDGSNIRCTMTNDPIETTSYTALSYCWDSQYLTKFIELNGYPFYVTGNLYAALDSIQRNFEHVNYLWVDAICINQNDIAERNREVYRMWQIYSSATQVLAWLGPEQKGTGDAFTKMHDLLDHCQVDEHGHCTQQNQANLAERPRFKEDHSLTRLLQNKYFSRTWILQEFAQAREVQLLCGKHSCAWRLIYHAISHAPDGQTFSRVQSICEDRSLIESLRKKNFDFAPDMDAKQSRYLLFILFNKVVELFRESECSDRRDRVYALLGHPLARRLSKGLDLQPDYEIEADELLLAALEWCDKLRDEEDGSRKGDLLYAPMMLNYFWRALAPAKTLDVTIPFGALLSLVQAHDDWDTSGLPDQLVLGNGRKIDCRGHLLSRLTQAARIEADMKRFISVDDTACSKPTS